jgi:hypothetical protein
MHDPVLVKRRMQQVVVRASQAPRRTDSQVSRRRHMPTLLGLGERDASSPTLVDDAPPDSGVRVRRRPVVLLDGVDDELATRYRAEAERILATGRLAELTRDYIGEAARILSSGELDQLLADAAS